MVSRLFPCSNFIFNVCIIFRFCIVSFKIFRWKKEETTIMDALLCRFPCLTEKQPVVNYLVTKDVILAIMKHLLTYHSPNDLTWKFGCCYFFLTCYFQRFPQMFCILWQTLSRIIWAQGAKLDNLSPNISSISTLQLLGIRQQVNHQGSKIKFPTMHNIRTTHWF